MTQLPIPEDEELRRELDWVLIDHGSDVATKLGFPSDPEVYEQMYKPRVHDARVNDLLELFNSHAQKKYQEGELNGQSQALEAAIKMASPNTNSATTGSLNFMLEGVKDRSESQLEKEEQ